MVGQVLVRVLKLSRDGDRSLCLIVFDCVLDNVEDDQLVQPPICLHGRPILVSLSDTYRHLFFGYLIFEWLEHLLNEFLWLKGAHLSNYQLSLVDLHFFNLIGVIEMKDLSGVQDLFVHIE